MHWLSTWVLARCPLPLASHSSSMLQGSASIEPTSLSSLCRRVPSVAALMLSTACTAHRSDSTTPKMGKVLRKKLNPGGSLSLHLGCILIQSSHLVRLWAEHPPCSHGAVSELSLGSPPASASYGAKLPGSASADELGRVPFRVLCNRYICFPPKKAARRVQVWAPN